MESLDELCNKYDLVDFHKYKQYETMILDIFNNNNIDPYKHITKLYIWIAFYYKYEKEQYDEMKKYYLMAIELNDSDAMYNLASYYQNIEKDYDNMKKYYLMAIELNNSRAMNNLAYHYRHIELNYDKMKKYYMMAVELNNSGAIFNLAHYYQHIEQNYDEMKKYYLMAIELNNLKAMYNLGYYYQHIELNYDKMIKYYLMAIEQNHTNAMFNLGIYYENIDNNYMAIKYYLMAIKLNHTNAKQYLKRITSSLQRYIYYNKHNIPFDEIITNDIHIYNNKLKISKKDKCNICFEDDIICILLNCFYHYTCSDCYIQIYNKECPFCRL